MLTKIDRTRRNISPSQNHPDAGPTQLSVLPAQTQPNESKQQAIAKVFRIKNGCIYGNTKLQVLILP
jgi:hypothetical protein